MTVHVYQDVYDDYSAGLVSGDAIPLVRSQNIEGLKEFQAFQLLTSQGAPDKADYIGLFSVKFANKMRITVAEAKDFVASNPGYDVYLFNPYPYESYLFFNQWESGEFHHPGIKPLAQILFDKFELGDVEKSPRMRTDESVFCNYWIGTGAFFKEYVSIMERLAEVMLSRREEFLSNTWHMNRIDTPYFTFILERMLGTILKQRQREFRALSYPVQPALFGSMIADDSPIRFEKKRLHFLQVREKIEALDQKFKGKDYEPAYKTEFAAINDAASSLIRAGIENLYVSGTQALPGVSDTAI